MNKIIKKILIVAAVAALFYFTGKLLFVRTVNYEIAGVKIPSEYNIITGKVRPIQDYKGSADLPTLEPHMKKSAGLSDTELAKAQFRGALFAQWVNTHPEYKGWDTDKDVSAKAHEAFKEYMKKFKGVTVIQ